MAKHSQTKRVAGKRFAFVGKFGYRDMWLAQFRAWVTASGGVLVATGKPADYLVAGEGRGGKPPGEVAKIQKQQPAIVVLSIADFAQLVLPDADSLAQTLRSGRQDHTYWESLEQMIRHAATTIDLRGSDFRNVDLYGAKLEGVHLDNSNLSGVKAQYTHFGELRGVKLDGADAPNVYLTNLDRCSFRRASLRDAWMFWGSAKTVAGCDFTAAKMAEARAEKGHFVDCNFQDADLSDAKLEGSAFERVNFTGADLSRAHAAKARLDGAILTRATLHRADLRDASLVNADLRNADLREAVLSGTDLTGANLAGADFANAVLTGAKVAGMDASKAKNFHPPVSRTVGPKVRELAAAAAGSNSFETEAVVDLGPGHFARLELYAGLDKGKPYSNARSRDFREGNRNEGFNWIRCPSFEQGMLNLADRWPNAALRLDSVKAKGSRTVRGPKLQELAAAAWAEAFGVKQSTPEDLRARQEAQEEAARRERDALMEKVRSEGVAAWNGLDYRVRDRIDLREIDLSGADVAGIELRSKEMQGSRFDGATLTDAKFVGAKLDGGSFSGAKLQRCSFVGAHLNGADFRGADLTGADLWGARLQGADLTGATLADASFKEAQYDDKTKLPASFTPPESMVWKGAGKRPGVKVRRARAGSMDLPALLDHLGKKVEPGRLDKARAMLRAERFQLFADVKEDVLVGVVKSQSSGELVYSCRLGSDGRFGCCTQTLRPCGGLRGAVCKHLLVLIVGLAKAGKLDPATVAGWVDASKAHRPDLDPDAMSDTFLRYKGAESGEIDWRPTETLPEDYYAL
jgi:uncharacterized protein YjbI with pentapeptide repeats